MDETIDVLYSQADIDRIHSVHTNSHMIVHGTQSARVLHDCPTLAQTHAHNGSLSHMHGCPSATSCLVSTSRLSSSRSLVSHVSSVVLLSLVPRSSSLRHSSSHPSFSRLSLSTSLILSLSHPRPPGRPQPAHMRHEQRASVDALTKCATGED